MAIKQVKGVVDIPSEELEDWGPVPETVDIKAGDTVYFDNNSKGTWEVLETVRKACLTYKRN